MKFLNRIASCVSSRNLPSSPCCLSLLLTFFLCKIIKIYAFCYYYDYYKKKTLKNHLNFIFVLIMIKCFCVNQFYYKLYEKVPIHIYNVLKYLKLMRLD